MSITPGCCSIVANSGRGLAPQRCRTVARPRPSTRMGVSRSAPFGKPTVTDDVEFGRCPEPSRCTGQPRRTSAACRRDKVVRRTSARAHRSVTTTWVVGPQMDSWHSRTGPGGPRSGAQLVVRRDDEPRVCRTLTDAVGCAIALADIRIEQGRLRGAMQTYERELRLATEQRPAALRGAADMHVGMSERFLERDDLDAAVRHLMISNEMGAHLGPAEPTPIVRGHGPDAHRGGRLGRCACPAGRHQRLYVADFYPKVRPIAALRARVWIDQGQLGEARDWPDRRPLRRRRTGLRPRLRARDPGAAPARGVQARRTRSRSRLRPHSCTACSTQPSPAGGLAALSRSWCVQALAHHTRGDIYGRSHAACVAPLSLAEPEVTSVSS